MLQCLITAVPGSPSLCGGSSRYEVLEQGARWLYSTTHEEENGATKAVMPQRLVQRGLAIKANATKGKT